MIKHDGVDIPTIKYIDPVDGEVDIVRVMKNGVQIWPEIIEVINTPTGIQIGEYEIATIDWDYTNMVAGIYDDDTLIQLSFINEILDHLSGVPPESSFVVKVNDVSTPVTGVSLNTTYVRLSVAAFAYGDEIKVSYTAGTNPLKAVTTGNLVPNITDVVLDNVLPEPAYTYLLDDYPGAAAAYSLRKLRTGVVQGIMVRRDSDDQLVDVQLYDDPIKSIDLDSEIAGGGAGTLGEWVGVASAFVFNWYDQSGGGKHANQSMEASQPRIINAGVLEIDGLYFDGSDDYLSITPNATVDEISIFTVSKFISKDTDNQSIITRRDSANDLIQLRYATASNRLFFQLRGSGGGLVSLGGDGFINTKYLLTGIMERPNPTTLFNNGVESELSTYDWGTQTFSSTKLLIGSVDNGDGEASFLFGNIDEIILYPSDQSANRTAIEDNINSSYNIWVVTAEVDAQLIQADNDNVSDTVIEINGVRSSASDTAVANLISRNVTVITN